MFTSQEQQEIKLFLALLFPWDDDRKNLWKSVTWTFIKQEGGFGFASYAAQSMDDMCRLISTRASRAASNVYVALGTQRMAFEEKRSVDGFPRASRTIRNIVSFKSLFVDIDVGKPGAYATTQEALDALYDMCAVTGMPMPTMEVLSGSGGLHAYWCFQDPVEHERWKPMALALQQLAQTYGLKFDPQVTVDSARILRVPNTFNHKNNPAVKVRIHWHGRPFTQYSYEEIAGALATFMHAPPPGRGTNQKPNRNFTAGVSESTAPPVSIDDVAVNCPAIADILGRAGDGDSEPLWSNAIYAASFTTDPHDAAHRLSDGDPRYVFDDTEKKLADKVNARANNPAAGWPTCQSFAALHPACATCPLLAAGKSPFHHARRPTTAQFHAQAQQPAGGDPLMPHDYWRDHQGHVLTMVPDRNGGFQPMTVMPYEVRDGGIDDVSHGLLRFEVAINGVGQWCEIDVGGVMQPASCGAALLGNNLAVPASSHKHTRDFLVSWVGHLQTMKRYVNQSAYGWTDDGKAFAFDDKIFRADGSVDLVYRGRSHNKSFTAVGDLQPWQDAMQLVYDNPPLELTVATAFASPLVEMIGTTSLVISLYSALSGIGKSTAMSLAQAVWGHPRTGMSTLADTTNAMMKKIGDLHNLPVYWDELRTKDQLEKVIDIVFQITQGKGKARMNKDTTLAEVPTFTTMFVVASNYGIGDTVYHQTESTEAGGLRLFEVEARKLTMTMSDHAARQLMIPLQANYGVAGATFAGELAKNRKAVKTLVDNVSDRLQARHQFDAKERFWAMTMTALLAGAMLANHWGLTRFDINGMEIYLDTLLAKQRGGLKVQEYVTMAETRDVVSLLQEMLADARKDGLIITETISYAGKGKPLPQTLVETDLSRVINPWIWMGRKDGRVRARVRLFNDYLRDRRLNPQQIIDALRGHYVVTQSKQTIGAGIAGLDALARFGRYECYDFTPLTSSPNPDSDEPS